MARITDAENEAHRKEREALRLLVASPGWTYVLGHVARVKQQRIDGMAAINGAPEVTRQHVYGYHDAKDLPEWPERRMAELDGLIKKHTQGE